MAYGGDFDDPQRGFDYWVSFKGQADRYKYIHYHGIPDTDEL